MSRLDATEEQTQMSEMFFHHQTSLFETGKFSNIFSNPEVLGEGGQGIVYKAQHLIDQKDYAVKRIYIALEKNQKIQNHRYFREVKAMLQLTHQNIVRYHCIWVEGVSEPIQQKVFRKISKQYQDYVEYQSQTICDSDYEIIDEQVPEIEQLNF